MHSVFRRLEGRRGTRGIDLVALPDVGENLLIVRRTHVTLLVLLDTTGCTLLRACREEHLHGCLGENDRADVAALDHVVARAADALLLGDKRLANCGNGGNWPHGAVDFGRADGIGHFRARDEDTTGNGVALDMSELDFVVARDRAERLGVVEGNAVGERLPRDGAVHCPRVKAREPEPLCRCLSDG